MTVGELKNLILGIPDNFIFEIDVERELSKEKLEKLTYKYPIVSQRCQADKDNYDIGWSENKIKLNIRLSENL